MALRTFWLRHPGAPGRPSRSGPLHVAKSSAWIDGTLWAAKLLRGAHPGCIAARQAAAGPWRKRKPRRASNAHRRGIWAEAYPWLHGRPPLFAAVGWGGWVRSIEARQSTLHVPGPTETTRFRPAAGMPAGAATGPPRPGARNRNFRPGDEVARKFPSSIRKRTRPSLTSHRRLLHRRGEAHSWAEQGGWRAWHRARRRAFGLFPGARGPWPWMSPIVTAPPRTRSSGSRILSPASAPYRARRKRRAPQGTYWQAAPAGRPEVSGPALIRRDGGSLLTVLPLGWYGLPSAPERLRTSG